MANISSKLPPMLLSTTSPAPAVIIPNEKESVSNTPKLRGTDEMQPRESEAFTSLSSDSGVDSEAKPQIRPSDNTLPSRDSPEAANDMNIVKHRSLENTAAAWPKEDEERKTGLLPNQLFTPTDMRHVIDPMLVSWDGPDDPENPQNLPVWRKWLITCVYSSLTMWVTFSTSVFSPATRVTAMEFQVSIEVMTFGTSLNVLGTALGPLIWGPLSELYGRLKLLYLGYAIFAIFQIPVAVAQNLETIMISRFLIGFFGTPSLAVIGGAFADFWGPVDRGIAVALFEAATYVGRIFGPIIGGFIVESSLGWRWTAWITLIASSFFGIIALLILPETYHPIVLQQRAARKRNETQNSAYHSLLDENPPTLHDILIKYLLRPFRMLALEPILLCITIYISLIYGILYLFFEAYPIAFSEVRRWKSAGVAALPFLGIIVGVLLGCVFVAFATKIYFARSLKQNGCVMPEDRLPLMIVGAVLLPIGLFWFGWTSSPNISWVPQVIAGVPMGIGILLIWLQGLNYVIDVYLVFANSAIAGNTLIRGTVAAAFPLFAEAMYYKLGVNWASSLLGFISVMMIPIPVVFYFYGGKIRALSRFTPKL